MLNINAISWVEIPVIDMDRAILFYNTVMDWTIEKQDIAGILMAWFPLNPDAGGSGGSLVQHEDNYLVSDKAGVLVYFACENVGINIDRVTSAGGQVLKEKTAISDEHGYMAMALDSEGNRIAFHSFS